ncbi:UDP-glucose/GDP-mannose dehydrogenase family protein [Amycolatopsis sp. WQ 127309]|uniref:UDP-glucose dehydrogenase family protein n=1 Tax=Amycolatopsis sp. WQ 127309 TaxID=2932773 RepID=UPI001FF649EC|nr:UDP-glucose/GDP-mannose dehydrogenase family protein [Amycolatopsis sp. WQ 127309]UOZ05678.1 UDP-glucose/GDP-mannose dehydrogenase family protein [Amycolatopsis sp. WQ 127309]
MRITVLGTGYLGATHAACMAEMGFEVLGMDTDPEKISALSAGTPPFYEPGLESLIRSHLKSGRLRFTSSYRDIKEFTAGEPAIHFLCVGTPERKTDRAADLRFLQEAIDRLAPTLNGPSLVVGKSTVPVGTAEQLARRLSRRAPAGAHVELAWNPEFLREGFAIGDTLRPARLVFGVNSPQAESLLREVYRIPLARGVPLVVTDLPTAELVKVSANAFLATKISFINAIAEICETTGADVTHLARALAHDPRIGGQYLLPGLGFGGGCLPKDLRAFRFRADELGVGHSLGFLREVDAINLRRRRRAVDLTREQCGGSLRGKRVTVWGAAFKPGSDDIRDSPALSVAASIQLQGGEVTVYDPKASDNARKDFPNLNYASSAVEAATGAEVLLHLTEWREFQELDPEMVGAVVANRQVIDGRNTLDAQRWNAAGWTLHALGRPTRR